MCVLAQYDTYNIMPPLLHPVHREGNVFTGTYIQVQTDMVSLLCSTHMQSYLDGLIMQ